MENLLYLTCVSLKNVSGQFGLLIAKSISSEVKISCDISGIKCLAELLLILLTLFFVLMYFYFCRWRTWARWWTRRWTWYTSWKRR